MTTTRFFLALAIAFAVIAVLYITGLFDPSRVASALFCAALAFSYLGDWARRTGDDQ